MISKIEPFHAIEISRLAHSLQDGGKSVIHMEFGQPSTGAPAEAVAAAQRALEGGTPGYWESAPLKERLSRHYRETYGVEVDPQRIILTCGASPALVLALTTAFQPGDHILFARPGYVAYRNCLRALHMREVEIECGPAERYQIDANAIAAVADPPAGLIVANPANPTGTIITANGLAAIADICRDRGIRIISDEIYHGLSFGEPVQSILQHAPDALVINSFSKYFSMPGWRLGWLIVPENLATEARNRMGNMFLTPPSLSQQAALAAFDSRRELEGHVEGYRRNRDLLLAALPGMGLREIAPPDGAFYIYASVAHLTDNSLSFCRRMLMDTGVAIAPGLDFDPQRGKEFVRISFAVSTDLVREAIARLRDWLPQQALTA